VPLIFVAVAGRALRNGDFSFEIISSGPGNKSLNPRKHIGTTDVGDIKKMGWF
jgi:hypothetical protein